CGTGLHYVFFAVQGPKSRTGAALNECSPPYIREPCEQNSVGGKWLWHNGLRNSLTLSPEKKDMFLGEDVFADRRKSLEINRTFFRTCPRKAKSSKVEATASWCVKSSP